MKNFLARQKIILLAFLAILTLGAVPAVAQMWMDLPILGGASFCASTVNNSCVTTVPAGPAMTGLETVPTDTNAANGVNPQTVKTPILALGAGVLTYNVPVTGATITLTNVTRQLIVEPAGTIANLTIVTPVATTLTNGQRLGVCTTQIVTSLTVTAGTGSTVANAPTALLVPVATGAGSCVEWIYRTANTTWYRVQ